MKTNINYFIFFIILNILNGKTYASNSNFLENEDKPITLHVTHQKHPRMKNLGYLQLDLKKQGKNYKIGTMNIHSPKKRPRINTPLMTAEERRQQIENYRKHGNVTPKVHTSTYALSLRDIQQSDELRVSFLQDSIEAKPFRDITNNNNTIFYKVHSNVWQNCEQIVAGKLKRIPLEQKGRPLSDLFLEIKWENLMSSQPMIQLTPSYN